AQAAGESDLRAQGRRARQRRREATAPDTRGARREKGADPHASGETHKRTADRDAHRQARATRRRSRAKGSRPLADPRIRSDPAQVTLGRALDPGDPARAQDAIPPAAIDAIEAV